MRNKKPQLPKLKPDVETLQQDTGYKMILELNFHEMIPFVLSNIRNRSFISFLYMFINTILLIFIILYMIWSLRTGQLNAGKALGQILAGILAGSILVIPPHELLHGLAYRILGARKIKFGADFMQFIFYVTADRFPISKRELAFLAMTPFVLINLLVVALTMSWLSQLTLFSSSLLLCHNIMCIGDFAMISYAYSRKGELYNYDDTVNKKSYFFEGEP